MTPWQVWWTFPLRHIQRFYLHAMREMWRERYWRMRLKVPKLKEPAWLYEDLDKKSAAKTPDDEYEKMKAYFQTRQEGTHGKQ